MRAKTKKIPREQLLNRVRMLAIDKDFVRKHVDLGEADKYVTATRIMQKGEYIAACFCHDCGTKYTVEKPFSSYYFAANDFKCPVCGNHNIKTEPGRCDKYSTKKHYRFIHKTDNGFEFVNFSAFDAFQGGDDWFNHNAIVDFNITTVGLFDRYNGFFAASVGRDYRVFRKNSQDEKSALFWLKDFTHSNVSDEECRELIAEAKKYHEAQLQKSKEASDKRKQKKEEEEQARLEAAEQERIRQEKAREIEKLNDPRWQYKTNDVDVDHCVQHPFIYKLYSTSIDGDTTYLVGCSKCGKIEEIKNFDGDKKHTCSCGNTDVCFHKSGGYRDYDCSQTAVFFENTTLPENDLLIRLFRVEYEMTNTCVEKKTYEFRRVFAGPTLNEYVFSEQKGEFDKERYAQLPMLNRYDSIVQSAEEVVEIVKNSYLKHSGLVDSWGLGVCKYNWSEQFPDMRYLRAWYKEPKIEMIMKSNLTTITQSFVNSYSESESYPINKEGKTLAEIFKVNPHLLKMMTPLNPGYQTLMHMQEMYDLDNTLTREAYQEIADLKVPSRYFTDLMSMYGIRYSKALQYLQVAYDRQCIDKEDCLSVWSDYLRMAKAIGIDLTDKSKRFPSSLKKDHDITMFAYRAIKIEMDQKLFAERAEINREKYAFENDKMIAIIPETPQEIIEEANAQNNCLRSYVERVRRGDTVVVFVRKKDDPDKTFLSAEIFDGRLTQLKGYCNSSPRDKDINDFVAEWSDAKNFIVSC